MGVYDSKSIKYPMTFLKVMLFTFVTKEKLKQFIRNQAAWYLRVTVIS